MSYQLFTETSLAEQRSRIRQMYESGELDPEVATAQLLRLDIDAIKNARGLNQGTNGGSPYASSQAITHASPGF